MQLKQCVLRDIKREGDRAFAVTLYDATELDRDGETLDTASVLAREPVTLQADHDRSVLMTLGQVSDIRWVGRRMRGVLTFAPEGVSEVADQVFRQVVAGITSTVSIGFRGRPTQAPEGHVVWTGVEVLELSFVSVPASPGARVDAKALARWLGRAGDDEVVLDILDDPADVVEVPDDLARALARLAAEGRAATARHHMNPAVRSGLVEPVFEIDSHELGRLIAEVVVEARAKMVADAVRAAVNKIRGRVD